MGELINLFDHGLVVERQGLPADVPNPEKLSDAVRDYYWHKLEEAERQAEWYRRVLGMVATETGSSEEGEES